MKLKEDDSSRTGSSLASRVFSTLEKQILDGTYAEGTALTELKLSDEFGVSRTPVREALFQLEREGLVKIQHNKGAVVIGISEKDIEDIYTIRMRIEGLATRWAAERITTDELERLTDIVELEAFYAGKGDIAQSRNLDTQFHSGLYDACGSKQLKNTLTGFHNYIGRAREQSFRANNRAVVAAEEHRAILEAVRAHDPDSAEELTMRHIVNAKANLLASLRAGGR